MILLPVLALFLSLAWVWKANRVKDYYSRMKLLEETRKSYEVENSKLHSRLAELKSLASIDREVTRRFGLTQSVAGRTFLYDPVKSTGPRYSFDFVDMDDVTDWLENAVVRSGSVKAGEEKEEKK